MVMVLIARSQIQWTGVWRGSEGRLRATNAVTAVNVSETQHLNHFLLMKNVGATALLRNIKLLVRRTLFAFIASFLVFLQRLRLVIFLG